MTDAQRQIQGKSYSVRDNRVRLSSTVCLRVTSQQIFPGRVTLQRSICTPIGLKYRYLTGMWRHNFTNLIKRESDITYLDIHCIWNATSAFWELGKVRLVIVVWTIIYRVITSFKCRSRGALPGMQQIGPRDDLNSGLLEPTSHKTGGNVFFSLTMRKNIQEISVVLHCKARQKKATIVFNVLAIWMAYGVSIIVWARVPNQRSVGMR